MHPDQTRKADQLLALHDGDRLLVLPNIWNPIGARVLAAQGYPAVATASAAVSASLGFRDGEQIRRSTLFDILGRIASSVELPVTADIEAGYAETLPDLEETISGVIRAGVVGINLEDGSEDSGPLRAIHDQCERIAHARQTSEDAGIHLVINARIDSFLSSTFTDRNEALEDAVARAAAYMDAGADCVYPIGPGDGETVRTLRVRIPSPINILVTPTAASLSELQEIGVNRVSFGPFLFRSLLRKLVDITGGIADRGDFSSLRDMLTRDETDVFLRDEPESDGTTSGS